VEFGVDFAVLDTNLSKVQMAASPGSTRGGIVVGKGTDSTAGFEQYLALGAGLHAIVDAVPTTAYPIQSWDDLQTAASSIDDVDLLVPGGKRSLQKEILRPNLLAIRRILGKEYFPIEDQQDFARKAGLVLMTLVVRHFGSPSPQESLDEKAAAEIEAFKREIAEQESTGRKAD
jgi:hypothetical protein